MPYASNYPVKSGVVLALEDAKNTYPADGASQNTGAEEDIQSPL